MRRDSKQSSASTESAVPPSRDAILALADPVMSLPLSVQQILAELSHETVSANSVAEALARDPPLSASVLRVANSPFYRGLTKASLLNHAVGRIGIIEVRKIVVNTAIVSTFGIQHDLLRDLYVQSLVASLSTPTIFTVAKSLPKTTAANPYSVPALLHDLGLFVLARFASSTYARCLALASDTKRPLVEVEEKVLGYAHTDIGATLLTKWGMAPMEIEACRWHHRPLACPLPYRATAHVVWLSDCVSRGALAGRLAQVLKEECEPRALAFLGIDETGTRRLIGGYHQWVDEAHSIVGQL